MKYIRTNYLIGEIISHTKLINGTHLFSIKGLDEILPISEEDFEKCEVADTIEELCDEFVIYADIDKCNILEKGLYHRLSEENKKALFIANKYIYGAIWTDKGLINVTKMNDKGEMELL